MVAAGTPTVVLLLALGNALGRDCRYDLREIKRAFKLVDASAGSACVRLWPSRWPTALGRSCGRTVRAWQAWPEPMRKAILGSTAMDWIQFDKRTSMLRTKQCPLQPARSLPSTQVWPTCLGGALELPRAKAGASIGDAQQLSALESWRVRRYLGELADAAYGRVRAGTRPAPGTPVPSGAVLAVADVVLFHTSASVAECEACTHDGSWRQYCAEMRCMLNRYERARGNGNITARSSPPRVWAWKIGDSTEAEAVPCIGKARSLSQPGRVALLPLETFRHQPPLAAIAALESRARRPFEQRNRCAVWRGVTSGPPEGFGRVPRAQFAPRRSLVEGWHNASTAATGGVRVDVAYNQLTQGAKRFPGLHAKYLRRRIYLQELVQCRYLPIVEGNDVATALKWALYTESVVLMPPPTKESWALEGSLQPWVHYVPVAPDFSDLGLRLAWCEAHVEHAGAIARAGSAHIMRVLGQSPASEWRVISAVLDGVRSAVEYEWDFAAPPPTPRQAVPTPSLRRGPGMHAPPSFTLSKATCNMDRVPARELAYAEMEAVARVLPPVLVPPSNAKSPVAGDSGATPSGLRWSATLGPLLPPSNGWRSDDEAAAATLTRAG